MPFSLGASGKNERVFGEMVTENYFRVLGLRPVLGSDLQSAGSPEAGSQPVAMISYNLWQTGFGGDPSLPGRSITVNGQAFTIVGVVPKNFSGLTRGVIADLWVPVTKWRELTGNNDIAGRSNRAFLLVGRRKPEPSFEQGQANFRLIGEQLARAYPVDWNTVRNEPRVVTLVPESQMRIYPDFRGPVVVFMSLFMSVVCLVLLIACANAANLLLARAMTRRREMAIRVSLGARRGRLIRQLLTESLILSLLGGAAGLLLALWATSLLQNFKPSVPVPVDIEIGLDWRVLAFTVATSLLTGIIFGLAPALATSRPDLVSSLKDEAGAISVNRSGARLRNVLVIVQVAISFLLLFGSGLFLRSLHGATSIHLGFDADNLLVMSIMDLRLHGYDKAAGQNFYRVLLERVRMLPGVAGAGLTEVPLSLNASSNGITIEGYTRHEGEGPEVHSATVTPGYFDAMRIPVLRGRSFSDRDVPGSPGVVIINEAFARRYWPGEQPLGKRIQMGVGLEGRNSSPYLEVVGVVKDGRYVTLGEEVRPFFYRPLAQYHQSAATLIVRTLGNPIDSVSAVREQIGSLDRNLTVYDVKTMRQHLGLALLPARLAGTILGVFGFVALILATSGIYGVMSYTVAQRTREVGIRLALGAQTSDVMRLIVRQGMKLVLIGLVIGMAGALALSRVMTSLLYGTKATEPLTFLAVSLLLGIVALLACYLPARRATRIEPLEALRYE
jgi:macrolide transport system ATP-binding/permease protein